MKGLKKLISIIALIILIGTDFLNPISYALEQEDKIFGSKEDINLENNMEEEYTSESSEENLKNLEENMIEKEEIENNSSKSEDNIDEKINETVENEDNSFGENNSENGEEIYKSLEESSSVEKENLDESLLLSDEVGLSGENNTKGELDILEGVELSPIELVSDSIEDVEEEIINKRTIELATAREILNEEEIIGQETYKNILVNVQASAGTFPEGVELRISPITTKNEIKEIKEQIVDSQSNIEEDPELVAFDISFVYTLSDGTEVELQPKENTVQVTFDYSNNNTFKNAEADDSQTIEVYHINDKDENGEKVEKGKETVEKVEINQTVSAEVNNGLVIDAEKFSTYTIVVQRAEQTDPNTGNPKTWVRGVDYSVISIPRPEGQTGPEGFTIMDRNLGADAYMGEEGKTADDWYGYYYQRGNNYGFATTGNVATTTTSAIYDATTMAHSGYYRNSFYKTSAGDYWENREKHDELWGGENDSQSNNRGLDTISDTAGYRQGPCPGGWHVPSVGEWNKVIEYWASDYTGNGGEMSLGTTNGFRSFNNETAIRAFLNYFKLPSAGYRTYNYSTTSNVSWATSYWLSSTAPTNAGGYNKARYFTTYLSQNSTYLRIGSNSRTYGFSVRCFRDVYEAPVVVYTVSFDAGTGTITVDSQEIESGSTASQPITQLTGYTATWYLDNGFVTPFDFDTPITGNIILYAKWNKNGGIMDQMPDFEYSEIVIDRPESISNGPNYYIIMDRNLGATNSGTGVDAYGYYYQWGNNYGFATTGTVPSVLKSVANVDLTLYGPNSIGMTPYYSGVYVTAPEGQRDRSEWATTGNDNIWGYITDTEEDRQGPCPNGWHIPSQSERAGVISYRKGGDKTIDLKLPIATNRGKSTSDVYTDEGEKLVLWTITQKTVNTNYILFSQYEDLHDLKTTEVKDHSDGLPIRCFKNELVCDSDEHEESYRCVPNTMTGFCMTGAEISHGHYTGMDVEMSISWSGSNWDTPLCDTECDEGYNLVDGQCIGLGVNIIFELSGGLWYDGSAGNRTVVVESGSDIFTARPNQDPYKNGYMFLGWFDESSNSTTRFKFQGTILTGDLTLTAHWAPFNDIVYTGMVGGEEKRLVLMDRNLGATATGAGIVTTPESYGYYYQWGNNYGFYYDNGTSINTITTGRIYNASGFGPGNWFYGETFVKGQTDWSSVSMNNLWGGLGDVESNNYDNGNKRYMRQGPCPKGYHVPSLGEWHKLVRLFMNNEYSGYSSTNLINTSWKNNVGGSNDANYTLTPEIFSGILDTFYIPSAGRVTTNYDWNRMGNNPGKDGYRAPFWSSTVKTNSRALGFEMRFKEIKFNLGGWDDERAGAKVMRCFKDMNDYTVTWKNYDETVLETDFYVYEGATPSYNGLENPTKDESSEFAGWYLEGDVSQTIIDLSKESVDSDRVYVAKFIPIAPEDAYIVTVDIDPSNGGEVEGNTRYNNGDTVILTGTANSGYEFLGWFTGNDIVSLDNPYVFIADNSGGTGFTAVFSPLYTIYTGTNNELGGTVSYEVLEISRQGKVIRFAANTNESYRLDKWILNGNDVSTGGSTQLDVILSGNINLTGYFIATQHTVIWKNWNNVTLATTFVTHGDHLVYGGAEPIRSRETPEESEYNFIFTGWTKNGDSQIIKDLSTEVVTGNVTYTAHYDQVYRNYIVKYNANGGLGTMSDQDFQLHTSGTLATNTFEKLGYDFAGWLSQSGGVSYTDGQEISLSINDVESSMLTDDLFLNLQAQWTPKIDTKVTVNYYLKRIDSGNNTLIDGVDVYLTGVEHTGTADSTVNIWSKYGTGIVGYHYDHATVFSGLERTGATETTVLPDGSREINMYYIPNKYNFTLNSDLHSSTVGSSESTGYYYGATVTLNGDSNNDCFTWSGWTTSGITLSDATLNQTGFAMPANAVSVTPSVKEKTYDVTFNGGDDVQGSMENLSGVMCTENIILNNSFSKIGHTFTGWSITSGGVIAYTSGQVVSGLSKNDGENVNLYAIWDVNKYLVTGSVAEGQENMGYLSGESTIGANLTGLYDFGTNLIVVAKSEFGYLFDYWEVNGFTGESLPEGVTISENQLTVIVNQILDIVAHFKPDIKTVTVNHFQENIGGGYTLHETESNFTGYVDSEFVASEKEYSGFVASGNNNKTIIISGNDSSNVINLYYERNKSHLQVSIGNGTNVQISPSCIGSSNYYNCEYYYDEEISINVVGGYEEGYSYSGWYNDQEYPLPNGTQLDEYGTSFRMPDNDVHLYLDITHNLYKLTFTGYEGTDISNIDTVTVDLTGENYFRFNDEIELPYLNKPGYNFVGWNSGDYNEWGVSYTLEPYHPIWHMPSHDVELTAEFTGRTDMEYYKYYYFQKTEGSGYVLSGDERFDDGITDQRVSSNCKYVEGFTHSRGEPDILYIKATGDNYINCYYDRDEYWVDVIYDNKELSVDGTGKYRYDAPVNLIATANTGYEFSGFSSEQPEYNTTSSTLSFNVPLGGPYSIYADANPIEYLIEYELDGGNYNPSWYENPTTYTIENPDIPLLNPEKDGYKFLGWTGGVISGGIEGEDDIVEPTRDLIITGGSIGDRKYYANWEPDEVKVTVNYYLKKLNTGDNVLIDGVDIYREGVIFTGIADRMVNISGTYLTGIVGYHYDHATVFSGGERIGATETTVLPDGSREINMYYIPNKYNFTLNSDLHSSTVGSSESTGYYYGANVILSGDSDNDCFTWSGWIINGITLSDATLQYTGFTMPANDVEVTPSVKEKTYNITFNGNESTSGEMLPMNGVKCTESTGLTLSIFEKKGYTFTGWSTISGDNIREYTDGQIVSGLSKNDLENVNLYAVWDINWYTVTFDLNGGFLTGDMTETTGYTIKTPSISLENYIPVKSGYTLIGWYKGDTLVDHIAGGEIGDYILDARWKADSDTLYTVKYYKENLNGGYDVWTGIYIGETDIEVTALVKDFTGFTYSGGNENNVTTGVIAGDGSLVLKLYYDRNKYPIIWKDGNGETLKTENLFYEMIPEYTGNIPTKAKTPQYTYIFNDKWLPNIESVTTGATYMAQFDAIVNSYTINIAPNNTDFGTISTGEINVEYGVTIVESGNKMIIGEIEIEANPNPADIQYTYEFDNWTNTCGPKLIGTCILQANFKRILNKYTITWRNEDGSVIDATQVEYGKKPTHTNPTKSDTEDYRYIFVGWTPEILPVIGNAEYTAIFKPEEKEKSGGGGMSGGGRKWNDVDSQHGSAEENVDGNEYTGEEILDDFNNNIVPLYKWSYENKITTINTLEEANPDGLVTRGHLAKMVVNYMINVLGRKVPYDVTYNCVHRGDNESSRESDEIRDYATKACAFGVMGINMENNEFLPNNIVTRAEFGTVISRMLRGDKYDIIDTDNKRYYENHLQVLKKDDILTQISNPEARWEIRKWVWLVFRRIIEKKK